MQKEIIRMYLEDKLSALKISEILNIKPRSVYYILEKNNISRRSNSINSRKFYANESFFESIDSEEKAYWLGFMYADGYIVSSRGAIGLSLSIKDEAHIERFLKSIGANNKVSRYRNNMGFYYSRVIIHSNKMKSDLINLGCFENKTFKIRFPEINKNLLNHFIRGYFDGDGAISKHLSSNLTYRFRLCGTYDFLKSVLFNIGFSDHKLYKRHKDRDNNNFDIDIGGNIQVLKILDYLYKDCTICLERKRDIYFEIKSLYVEMHR